MTDDSAWFIIIVLLVKVAGLIRSERQRPSSYAAVLEMQDAVNEE